MANTYPSLSVKGMIYIYTLEETTDMCVITKNRTRKTWSIRRPRIHYMRPENSYGYDGV